MELIRKLTEDDADQYYRVRLRGLREHPEAFGASAKSMEERTLDQIAERLRSNSAEGFCIFGAFVDQQLVGLSAFGCPIANPKMRHRGGIYQMYVMPEYRARGLGQKLLVATIDHARHFEWVEELMLGVAVGNDAARNLYLRVGFQPCYVDPRSLKVGSTYYDTEFMSMRLE